MLYVPVIPPQPPSPRTRELAELLARTIQEYEKYHPDVSGGEVRTALRLAAQSSRKTGPDSRLMVVAATLAAILGVFLVVAVQARGAGGGGVSYVAVSLAAFAILFMVAFLIRHERR